MEPLRGDDPRQVGRYRLIARLGSGGMGQVFLGLSPAGRQVAVKVVHPELARDRAFLSRFRQEAAAARKVSGAYTASVVDAGDGDRPWLATALVIGPSLVDAVEQQGPLPEVSVWRLAAGLAEALAEVHACGLIHRDLKPSNVLLAADGPRVIDFGISRALDGTAMTGTGMVIGTPGFMSPEQTAGIPVGPASDVFSFGAVLVFAATGSGPFGDGTPMAMMYRVVHGEPELGDLPEGLAGVVRRCLTKRPEDRPTLAALMDRITDQLASVSPTMTFWPQALADYIDSYRTNLITGWQSPAQEPPPPVPAPASDGAEPELAPEPPELREPPDLREPEPQEVPELREIPREPADRHVPDEAAESLSSPDAAVTITSERPRSLTPPPSPPRSEPRPAAARPRRYKLIAGAGLLAVAALITVIVLPASAPPVASGPKSTLTIEASYVAAGSMPSASPRVTVSIDGSSPAVLGAPAKVPKTFTLEWTDTVHARSVRVCIKPPPGWTVAGQSCFSLTEPGAPALLFPLTFEG
jgi:serine/threonine protein kinase